MNKNSLPDFRIFNGNTSESLIRINYRTKGVTEKKNKRFKIQHVRNLTGEVKPV